MSDDEKKKTGIHMPPKLDLKKSGILKQQEPDEAKAEGAGPDAQADASQDKGRAEGERAQTARISITPPESAAPGLNAESSPRPVLKPKPPADAVQVGKLSQKKKETSRIPLEAATGGDAGSSPAPSVPKTIRLKPVAKPGGGVAGAQAAAAKRETSRISLESALAGQSKLGAASGQAQAPKTIKLKRPSEAPTVKAIKPGPAETVGPSAGAPASAKLSETSRIDAPEPQPDEKDVPPTRRKTIRVKRPGADGHQAPKPVVKRAAAGPAEAGGAVVETGAVGQPVAAREPHWFFAVSALAAILVILVTLYVFMAQLFGPDYSLTKLSYWRQGPDLPWPNKLMLRR